MIYGVCATQGDQPHCGFPEAKYLDCVERLVRHGLRVVVVEQTETPEMLKQRNDSRAAGTKKVGQEKLQYSRVLRCLLGTTSRALSRLSQYQLLVPEQRVRGVVGQYQSPQVFLHWLRCLHSRADNGAVRVRRAML